MGLNSPGHGGCADGEGKGPGRSPGDAAAIRNLAGLEPALSTSLEGGR